MYLLLQVIEERRIEELAKADLPTVAKLLERNDARALRELSSKYPIRYHVVLAYMPEKRDEYRLTDYSDTILLDGIKTALKRFAINYQNKWMIEQSDFVITYVVRDAASDAAQFKKLAERKGKTVIELSSTKIEYVILMDLYILKNPFLAAIAAFSLIFAHLHHYHELQGSNTYRTYFPRRIEIMIKLRLK